MICEMRKRKQKLPIWKYGRIKFPLIIGKPAQYYQNGFWIDTDPVERILEKGNDHITFETGRFHYYFEFQKAGNAAICMAA